MKAIVPAVIISFTLGFFCNEFLFKNEGETGSNTDLIMSSSDNGKIKQEAHNLVVTNAETDIELDTLKNSNQNKSAPSVFTPQDFIDLVIEKGVTQENYDLLQEKIENLSLEEQTALHAEIIRQLPNVKLYSLLSLVTQKIVNHDPSLLVELIRNSEPEAGAIVAQQGLVIVAAQTSLEEAWNLADSLGPGNEEALLTNDELRSSRFGILMSLSKDISNLNETFNFVSALKGRDKVSYLSMVVSSSAREDLISTRQQIMDLPAGESKTRAVTSLMRIWSDENASEAMDWLIGNPDVTDKYAMINTAEQLLNQDGSATFSDYYENTDSDEVKLQLASAAAKHYVNTDIEQSIDWLKTVNSSSEQSSAVYLTLNELGYEQNMDKHIQVLDSVYSGDNSRQAKYQYSRTLSKWSEYEPEQVKAYVENLSVEQAELKEYLLDKLDSK